MKKVAIIGSRSYRGYPSIKEIMQTVDAQHIISGGAQGADSYAIAWASHEGIPTTVFYAEWGKYGKPAGAIRNAKIVDEADEVIAIWDGKSKGTAMVINMCERAGKPCHVILFNQSGGSDYYDRSPMPTDIDMI